MISDASFTLTAQLCCVPSIEHVLAGPLSTRLFSRMFTATYSSDCVTDAALDLYIKHPLMSHNMMSLAIRRSLVHRRLCIARHLLAAADPVIRMQSLMYMLLTRNKDGVECVLPYMTIVALCEMQVSPDCARYRNLSLWQLILDHIANSEIEYDPATDTIDADDPESSNDAIGSSASV